MLLASLASIQIGAKSAEPISTARNSPQTYFFLRASQPELHYQSSIMSSNFDRFWESARHMTESVIGRLPAFALSIIVFVLFYILSVVVSRVIRRATRGQRQNLGM